MSDKSHPVSPGARLADLNRQGFMRGRKVRTPKEPPPIVACDACLNWHRKGQHTATREERAANLAAEKARQAVRMVSVDESPAKEGDTDVITTGQEDTNE